MRKTIILLVLVVGLVMAVAAPLGAAELHEPHQGSACPDGYVGTWHFVNNQTDGAEMGYLTVYTDAGIFEDIPADKVNRNNQHWTIERTATVLFDAETNLPGRLVLSDFYCTEVKKG